MRVLRQSPKRHHLRNHVHVCVFDVGAGDGDGDDDGGGDGVAVVVWQFVVGGLSGTTRIGSRAGRLGQQCGPADGLQRLRGQCRGLVRDGGSGGCPALLSVPAPSLLRPWRC